MTVSGVISMGYLGGRLIIIDLEELKWLKRPHALKPASGNARYSDRAKAGKFGQQLPSSPTTV